MSNQNFTHIRFQKKGLASMNFQKLQKYILLQTISSSEIGLASKSLSTMNQKTYKNVYVDVANTFLVLFMKKNNI
ncbi:unnamed protein product [Paramecium sonneborni]|uniref:Uncharacterized protein n=1 Tax=Paramecium sonneborni TaxID=65129 RepID=A0A8S1QKH3_9CILI|nr:unnamed protein product [Paramecium sonneborni]